MNGSDANDWVDLWLNGSREAFEMLVRINEDAVYNLAYQMCGNPTIAEDIAQETFIRAYQKGYQYNPDYAFRNWVLGICANLSRSGYRLWRRKLKAEQAYANELEMERERCDREGTVSNDFHELRQALAKLPAKLRAPIVLQSMEGMSVREVAATLKIGLSAAKMRIARGREQLRTILQGTDERNYG